MFATSSSLLCSQVDARSSWFYSNSDTCSWYETATCIISLIIMSTVFPRNPADPQNVATYFSQLILITINAALEISPHGKGSIVIYVCTHALHYTINNISYVYCFPKHDISCTYLVEDRATFHANE